MLTESSVKLDAGRRRKQSLPVLPSAQARLLEEADAAVVVERVFAVGIRAVDRDALEALDSGSWKVKINFKDRWNR